MRRSRFSSACVVGILLSGCTQPTFDPADGGQDAATPAQALLCEGWGANDLPEGARALVGRYALQSVSFGYLDLAPTVASRVTRKDVALASISEQNGALFLSVQLCSSITTHNTLGQLLTATGKPFSLESYPVRSLRLKLGPGCTWSAAPVAPIVWGYSAPIPMRCTTPLANVPAQEQPWLLSETCQCPANDGLVANIRDCRVTDPDRDGRAGVTLTISSHELGDEVHQLAYRIESAFNSGTIDGSSTRTTLRAREHISESVTKLACDSATCEVGDTLLPCHDNTTRVTLQRIEGAETSCEAAIRTFWSEAELAFPEHDCPQP